MALSTDTTVTFEEWKNVISSIKLEGEDSHLQYIRIDAAKYLIPVLAGFITAPVAVYNNSPVAARVMKVDDIIVFRAELAEMVAAGKQILLYMPIWVPGNIAFTKIDLTTFDVIDCDPPEKTDGFWKIRFAIVE